jgi:hypothetical protein
MPMTQNGSQAFAPKWEPWLFYLVIAFHLFPLFTLHFFPTVDGAAHVYNARIINGLLLDNPVYESFYTFNKVPEPNWLGHALLSILNMIFPALVAEKIMIGMCIALLPLSFRKLVVRINPSAAFASYLIFPFIYSFMFITGFFNFCLSLPLLFWAAAYWIEIKDSLTLRQGVLFSLLIVLLFFCHMFAFALICIIAGLMLPPVTRTKGVAAFLRRSLLLMLMALPAIVLAAYFLYVHHTTEPGNYFEKEMLLKMLYGIQAIMTHSYEEPTIYAKGVFFVICILFVLAIAYRMREKRAAGTGDIWLLLSLVLFAMYLILPDTTAGGGFISLRLNYYFFLFLVIWICTVRLPKFIIVAAAAVTITASAGFVIFFHEQLKEEDKEAQEYYSLATHIREGSVVMPLRYAHNWRYSHFSNYLGYEKDVIILENYEASSDLFPVVWEKGYEPFGHMGDIVRVPPCADIDNYISKTGIQIDYIVQWKYTPSQDSCAAQLQAELAAGYEEKFRSANGNAVLFERKK